MQDEANHLTVAALGRWEVRRRYFGVVDRHTSGQASVARGRVYHAGGRMGCGLGSVAWVDPMSSAYTLTMRSRHSIQAVLHPRHVTLGDGPSIEWADEGGHEGRRRQHPAMEGAA